MIELPDLDAFTVVIVEWHDAYGDVNAASDNPAALLESYRPVVRRSVGFWAGATDAVVAIFADDDRTESHPNYCSTPSYIPRAMVKSVTKVTKRPVEVKFS